MANVTLSLTVVKPIKDAARAAKKGMGRVMQRFQEFTVTRLLDLPEFVAVGCEIEQRGSQEIVHLYCLHPHLSVLERVAKSGFFNQRLPSILKEKIGII